MGHGYKHGAGGSPIGLNFKVVGGVAKPANPVENTIWINTDEAIQQYIFSSEEPENPTEGMVWIATGTSSAVAFNAFKKNGMLVYPLYAQQYMDDEWISVATEIYQASLVPVLLSLTYRPNSPLFPVASISTK